MATTDVRIKEVERKNSASPGRPLLVGVALCSFSALLLELGLTRLFSVVLFYHFAFLAISIALLGLGAGGVFAHLRREWLLRWETQTLGPTICALCSLSIVVVLEIVTRSAVHLSLGGKDFRNLSILYLASAVPFFLVGLLFSVLFARNPAVISRLYAADLAGGALACLATVFLLNHLGGPNTILCAALTMAIASMLWAKRQRWRGGFLATAMLILIIANSFRPLIDIRYAKGERRGLYGVEYARWNAISRVEVDRTPDGARYITIDSDASTAIMNVDPHHWEGSSFQRSLMASVPSVVNILRPHGEFAIIGPGGGVDVLRAVASGSPKITGIEINPIIVNDVMKGRFANFSYHLYQIPEVNVHVSDGRSFVRNSRERYDVVQMTLVDTWASTAAGAFALSENNLYTIEAFKEYFAHLRPDGMLAITRWEFKEPREALRVISVAMEALHHLGVANPAPNFMVISDGALNSDGRPVLVLAKKTPFTRDEESRVLEHLRAHPNLVPQYLATSAGDNVFSQMIRSNDPAAFARSYKFNVAPVNDNAPFFFFTLKLGQLLGNGVAQGIDWKVNVGVAVLGIVLLLSLAAVLVFLILPLALQRKHGRGRVLPLMYFVAVGLGYILIEIAFIQRFVLFLGHPTYALTVVIFLMLLASGTGSFLSRALANERTARWPLALIVIVTSAYVVVLPFLLSSLVGLPFGLKLIISALILIPLGLAMGMPFPIGLRALAGATDPDSGGAAAKSNSVEWAWAMNAASSVLGSVLAMVIAIRFGLGVTLACGALAYAVAALISGSLQPVRTWK